MKQETTKHYAHCNAAPMPCYAAARGSTPPTTTTHRMCPSHAGTRPVVAKICSGRCPTGPTELTRIDLYVTRSTRKGESSCRLRNCVVVKVRNVLPLLNTMTKSHTPDSFCVTLLRNELPLLAQLMMEKGFWLSHFSRGLFE